MFLVADQLEDDPKFEQPHFDKLKNEPLALVDWSNSERFDLSDLMRPVIEYSKWWETEDKGS